jgi:uncharacterized protein YndB with AHSA1/START domain
MSKNKHIAAATVKINAPISKVWDALTNPATIKKSMFGTDVVSDWNEGSKITWKGEWEGKAYEDRGVIQKMIPEKLVQYTHYSPTSGQPDVPESYHTVTIELKKEDSGVSVTLTQDNNATEQAKEHSEKNWKMMLESLKKFLEE